MEAVTVITANYNGSRYLGRAIDSVLRQSYPNIEYLIVDDGSSDESPELIRRYAAEHPQIRPIFLEHNVGVAQARNTGIEQARGDFITFLDADDMWTADKIEKQVAVMRDHPRAGLVVTDTATIDENDAVIEQKKSHKHVRQGKVDLYDYLAGNCYLYINAMTRRECIERCGMFNPNYVIGEDYELWMRITREYEYYFLGEPLHLYRRHNQNATRDKLFNRQSKIKILEELMSRNPDLVEGLGRRFRIIMQRKYNSLGKAYYMAGRLEEATDCFRKTLAIRGSLLQRAKAGLWQMAVRTRRSSQAL